MADITNIGKPATTETVQSVRDRWNLRNLLWRHIEDMPAAESEKLAKQIAEQRELSQKILEVRLRQAQLETVTPISMYVPMPARNNDKRRPGHTLTPSEGVPTPKPVTINSSYGVADDNRSPWYNSGNSPERYFGQSYQEFMAEMLGSHALPKETEVAAAEPPPPAARPSVDETRMTEARARIAAAISQSLLSLPTDTAEQELLSLRRTDYETYLAVIQHRLDMAQRALPRRIAGVDPAEAGSDRTVVLRGVAEFPARPSAEAVTEAAARSTQHAYETRLARLSEQVDVQWQRAYVDFGATLPQGSTETAPKPEPPLTRVAPVRRSIIRD